VTVSTQASGATAAMASGATAATRPLDCPALAQLGAWIPGDPATRQSVHESVHAMGYPLALWVLPSHTNREPLMGTDNPRNSPEGSAKALGTADRRVDH
jgi:hypothetical protein